MGGGVGRVGGEEEGPTPRRTATRARKPARVLLRPNAGRCCADGQATPFSLQGQRGRNTAGRRQADAAGHPLTP